MRINGCCNMYAPEGAADQMPPPQASAPQPQTQTGLYPQTQPAVLDTPQGPPAHNVGVPPYGTGGAPRAQGNNGNDADSTPTSNATEPSRPPEPGAANRPGNSVNDANGNHVRDRWDESGTHVRDSWNDRNGTHVHELWNTEGTHVRDAWNEQTGQHVRDTWASDGAHERDAWDERGNHLQEIWGAQGQYRRNAWNESTARAQDTVKREHDGETDTASDPGKPVASTPGSSIDVQGQPGTEQGDTDVRQPGEGERQADPPESTPPEGRPVANGQRHRETTRPEGYEQRGATRGDDDGGGSAGPTAGNGGGSAGPTGGNGSGGTGTRAEETSGSPRAAGPENPGNSNNDASARMLSFIGFNDGQQAILSASLQKTKRMVDSALDELRRTGGWSPAFEKWFGKPDPAKVAEVEQVLRNIQSSLANDKLTFIATAQDKDKWEAAHVFADSDRHEIFVTPHFFELPGQMEAAILGHELSHFNNVGGTRDNWYYDENGLAYKKVPRVDGGTIETRAETQDNLKAETADTYRMFLQNQKVA